VKSDGIQGFSTKEPAMDILQIPAVAIFTGMIVSFIIVMMAVTLSDAIKG